MNASDIREKAILKMINAIEIENGNITNEIPVFRTSSEFLQRIHISNNTVVNFVPSSVITNTFPQFGLEIINCDIIPYCPPSEHWYFHVKKAQIINQLSKLSFDKLLELQSKYCS